MKINFALFVCLPLLVLATSCGKHDDQPAAVVSNPVAANSCQSGYVYNPQYGCLPAQYGQPPGYNGQPVNVTIPTNHYCAGTNGGYGYGPYGMGGNACWNNGYSYHWQYYAGFYYYW